MQATTAQMKRATGVKIAERIVQITDALGELAELCEQQRVRD